MQLPVCDPKPIELHGVWSDTMDHLTVYFALTTNEMPKTLHTFTDDGSTHSCQMLDTLTRLVQQR